MKQSITRAFFCIFISASACGNAQTWKPEKNIEIIIGLSAGSSQDRTGRSLQKVWQETKTISVPVNVVNRPSGGGQIALTALSQHPGDGHYLYVSSPTFLTGYITGLGKFQFTDFTPLALLGKQYLAVATRPESAVKTGRDLLERLKRDPYTYSMGINGAGGTLNIVAGLLVRAAGGDPKKARIIAFTGAELMTAGIGGHVDAIVTVASNILPHVESGKLRLLATYGSKRTKRWPTVPTLDELGYQTVSDSPFGVCGPKGMDPSVDKTLHDAFRKTLDDPAVMATFEKYDQSVIYMNTATYTKFAMDSFEQEKATIERLGMSGKS